MSNPLAEMFEKMGGFTPPTEEELNAAKERAEEQEAELIKMMTRFALTFQCAEKALDDRIKTHTEATPMISMGLMLTGNQEPMKHWNEMHDILTEQKKLLRTINESIITFLQNEGRLKSTMETMSNSLDDAKEKFEDLMNDE